MNGTGGQSEQGAAGARGRTTIAGTVVEKIAYFTARDVDGVNALGSGLSRSVGALRQRVPGGTTPTHGVKVDVGEKQTAIDLDLVVEYGEPITEVAVAVRKSVISAVERMTGLEVVEVNIAVSDVKVPEEEEAPGEERGSGQRVA
ncbi:Asp23/Gls24 family envelope stress response protein [Streptomyces sp. NPDC048644]|uniref:Asp23/Gls24 family envelope stress response protein n=1 Tax=Streptomyces sp. NPDC048644 TaxID=3365582 RepID=UPI0037219097